MIQVQSQESLDLVIVLDILLKLVEGGCHHLCGCSLLSLILEQTLECKLSSLELFSGLPLFFQGTNGIFLLLFHVIPVFDSFNQSIALVNFTLDPVSNMRKWILLLVGHVV